MAWSTTSSKEFEFSDLGQGLEVAVAVQTVDASPYCQAAPGSPKRWAVLTTRSSVGGMDLSTSRTANSGLT